MRKIGILATCALSITMADFPPIPHHPSLR